MKITIDVSKQEINELRKKITFKVNMEKLGMDRLTVYDRIAARVLMASVGEKNG